MTNENRRQQEIEDEFFGEPNALKLPEDEAIDASELQSMRSTTSDKAREAAATNTSEYFINRLQQEGRLSESLYAPQLVRLLDFLGKKMGLKINIKDAGILFPNNSREIQLDPSNLERFLKRGALAATFLMPLVISGNALAQELQPGMEIIEEGVQKVVNEGHYMFHWENLTALLLLLGVSALVIKKLRKKYQKSDNEKVVAEGYSKFKKAQKRGDKVAEDKAKQEMLSGTMGEMPADIDKAAAKIATIDKDQIKKAAALKKFVDQAIKNATQNIELAMVLPEEKSVAILEELKHKVLNVFAQELEALEKLYEKLAEEWTNAPENSYLQQQIEYEKKKLKYIIDYLNLMQKKWLVVVQIAKNELITDGDDKSLNAEDQLQKDIYDLQAELSSVLNNQSLLDPGKFAKDVQALDDKIAEKSQRLPAKKEKTVGWDKITLHNNGNYNHTTGIDYTINGKNYHIDIEEDYEVQIWINESNKIQMNFNHKGVLIDFKPLIVVTENGFAIKETGQTLIDYINEKQQDEEIKGTEASAELLPEAAPVLNELAKSVATVSNAIKEGNYQTFGSKVQADDDAIKYHLLRIHREFQGGKANTVVRFALEEAYWKKALAGLDSQSDIPKSTVNFNFENDQGGKVNINQPMRRFNVLVGGKQATVLITANEQYRALAGEVRIIFGNGENFSEDETKKVFAEVFKRLGLNDHIKPVTPAARKKLQAKLKNIRQESYDAAGSITDIHPEYSAEKVQEISVENLQGKGLHSVYHQFDLDVIASMFKAGKLLSTSTRWAKGVLKSGMSSTTDMGNGGATEVFMRCHTKKSAQNSIWYASKPAVVFGPSLMARMDCYCFASDLCGSKMPGVFDQRISPEKLITQLNSVYSPGHEVMMYDAVDLSEAQYIVYDNPSDVIEKLKAAGIHTIGGKPLEKAVITREQFKKINLVT